MATALVDSAPEQLRDVVPSLAMHEAIELVLRIGGLALLDRVVTLFRSTSEERVGKLRSAVAAGERMQVARLAHAMRGSAAQVGAEALRAVAAALESESAALDDGELSRRVELLASEVTRAWHDLEHFRPRQGTSR